MTLALNLQIRIFPVRPQSLIYILPLLIFSALQLLIYANNRLHVFPSGSPFKVPVDYNVDTTSVRAYGPGLDPKNLREGIPQTFKVDASKAGRAPLTVDVLGEYR